MLVPLTRKKFEDLIPQIATGPQYAYCWGKFPDFLKRLLISVVAVVVVLLVGKFLLGEDLSAITFFLGIIAGLYWLWAPVYWASLRNASYRRYAYSGFWRGEVVDIFVSEELIGEEQTVNNRGQLVIVENRERRLNIEVGDETGFTTQMQVPLRRIHKAVKPGQVAEMVVLSNQKDLGRIAKVTDIYIPSQNLWVSDYPYLRRDFFEDVSRQLGDTDDVSYPEDRTPKRRRSRRP
ncbi:phosphate ABC transporter permease [Coleofasciculus sp. FACHB-SPT36]|uniref:phosphate ABC transporter permease n=1 Tax=Cyanophyceae TaxID=3028117 RepID=UPI00168AF9ED|nr:phosphate ABC transporter permease [Coleofasciculus sp. FACHB-SPT36]MBD2538587.1 phosphate ABC transporter permease [Coleofasciculus sp. FACHB-SPT36]